MKIFKKKIKIINGIYTPEVNTKINDAVDKLYTNAPFPTYNDGEDKNIILKKGNNNYVAKQLKTFIGYGKIILEIGCGTGHLSNYLGIGNNNTIVALDPVLESIRLGKKFADKNNIKNIIFVNANIFDDIFCEEIFDLIFCSGVLHHTEKPKEGFNIIANYSKKNGIVVLGLYNRFGRGRIFLRQIIYKFISKKLALFLDPYLRKNKNISKQKYLSWEHDQYRHPLEKSYTFDNALEWFNNNNIKFINYYPSELLEDKKNNLFYERKLPNFFVRICEQFYMFFSKIGDEGGLFIFIGKKK